MTVKGNGLLSGTVTFTGTVVHTPTLDVSASGGVLIVRWSGGGLDGQGSGERWAFYDERMLGIRLAIDLDGRLRGEGIGSRIVWAGTPEMIASR